MTERREISHTVGADHEEPLVTRVLNVPRARVFAMWTDPDQVAQWDLDEFVIPRDTITIEARVGGRYEYCMVEVDDGTRFWLRYRIVELVEPELLVLESEPMPQQGYPEPFLTTIRFDVENDGHGTRMTLHRPYPPDRRSRAAAAWSSLFDQMEALLQRSP